MKTRDHFGSKIGFILAAAGSAIGLGAIWKFPYMAGTNGGGVFVLLFILCTLLIGLPILLAEFIIGRKGQADAVTGFKKLAPKKPWFLIGWSGFFFSFIILSFYSVVGGWILSYLFRSITLSLNGSADNFYEDLFNTVISNPWEVLIGQGVFILLTLWIVSGGIKGGIEKASKWMMPLLLIFFVVLAIRSLTLDGAIEGVKFLLIPDWSYFTWETALLALGQAFFSLSVGVSGMITYASYLPKGTNLGNSALSVSLLNIGISIMAGLVIFPAVFALGFSPDAGPGLVFIILPAVFEQIIFGQFFLIIFFILLLFATLTSSISMLEIVVSIGIKSNYDRRKRAAWISGFLIFLVGIPSALSFGVLQDIKILDLSIFDFADFLTSSIGLPLGALFISIFAGFHFSKDDISKEIGSRAVLLNGWRIIVRYAAPVAILIVFIQGVMNVLK
ncbi:MULTISPECIES: sodium-dependent transporter [Psychrobacillus]|uniref:Transporter n=1 Tax=Psychrobacillus faecigallinarum TaxID=2762235 RepID=A0ABR8RD62_9BACI|nr:sodium-dependent transporter [Psychrobacillus faecigallinarum]MBD7945703.1 sodium-dependent transporter [Psychrobacillus faecigallinarum]QGM29435.1 sodium-dependent transporter [Bacillus sp. N3536]